MLHRYILYFLSSLLLFNSCITKFTPEIDEYDNIIVVEGLLTDEDRTNYIKLSRTIPTGLAGLSSPLTGAHVLFRYGTNEAVVLDEKKPGYYCTDSLTFRGEVGETYKLQIVTSENEVYESTPMLMKEVPDIDSLYSEFEFYDDRLNWPPLFAYNIYFDSYDDSKVCRYYRWTYEEVWEYHLPWHYPEPEKSICWISNNSSEILIKNNSALEEDRISKFPLIYLDNKQNEKLFQKYSLLLKQYSISEDEYLYWDSMKKLTQEQGGLYDPIPKPLIGNIISVDKPSEPVLGYFSVSSVAKMRHFIENDTIKYLAGGQWCVTDTVKTIEEISGLNSYVFILAEIDGVGFLVSTFRQCADCTVSGTNIAPSYWYDEE